MQSGSNKKLLKSNLEKTLMNQSKSVFKDYGNKKNGAVDFDGAIKKLKYNENEYVENDYETGDARVFWDSIFSHAGRAGLLLLALNIVCLLLLKRPFAVVFLFVNIICIILMGWDILKAKGASDELDFKGLIYFILLTYLVAMVFIIPSKLKYYLTGQLSPPPAPVQSRINK